MSAAPTRGQGAVKVQLNFRQESYGAQGLRRHADWRRSSHSANAGNVHCREARKASKPRALLFDSWRGMPSTLACWARLTGAQPSKNVGARHQIESSLVLPDPT